MNAMTSPNPRVLDIEDVERFDALVTRGAASMHGWHLHSVDLRDRTEQLRRMKPAGAIFLGCSLPRGGGEPAFGRRADLPAPARGALRPYRGRLYTGQELTPGWKFHLRADPDARVYQWSLQEGKNRSLDATLATAMHDHAIGDR